MTGKTLYNWLKTWAPIILSIAAISIACSNHELTRRLEKLDFRPGIRLTTFFSPVKDNPSYLTITNTGPVEAVQIRIRMFTHRYFSKTGTVRMSLNNSLHDIDAGKLTPRESKDYIFNDTWLNINARLIQPPEHNIMEIQITYRRPQDLKEYDESAFYFVNPKGSWAPENSSSLNTEPYKKIKKEMFDYKYKRMWDIIYKEWSGDSLHENNK